MTQQKAVLSNDGDEDVIAMARGIDQCCVQIFFVRGGKIVGRENYFLRGTDDSSRGEVLASFVKQFYLDCQFIPRNILLETELEEQAVLEQWLTEKRGNRVYIKVPRRGQAKDLVELVGRNASEALAKQELEETWSAAAHHRCLRTAAAGAWSAGNASPYGMLRYFQYARCRERGFHGGFCGRQTQKGSVPAVQD